MPLELNEIDVAALRKRMGMTQKQFSRRFGFSLATLRHWEHGDRKPSGTALVLLHVIRQNPRVVVKTLLNAGFRQRTWDRDNVRKKANRKPARIGRPKEPPRLGPLVYVVPRFTLP